MTARIADRAALGAVEVRRWSEQDGDDLQAVLVASADHLRPRMAWIDLWLDADCDPAGTIRGWNADWERGGDLYAGVFEGELVVGAVGLHRRIGPEGLEVGYWLADGATGRGLATAAAGLATDLAFADRAIARVRIAHCVTNAPSEGIPRRLGYRLIGDEPVTRPLGPADTGVDRIWEIARADWPGYASLA